MKAPPIREVLLVEDDPDDVMLMKNALESGRGLIDLKVVSDGVEAMTYLRGEGAFIGTSRPALILLDWRLPRKSGEEVLRELRGDAVLRLIPVLVLTTSGSDADIRTAYSLGANAFLTKPTGAVKLKELISLIERFWLDFVSLPSKPEPVAAHPAHSDAESSPPR